MKIALSVLLGLLLPFSASAAIYFDTDFETCPVGTGADFPCEGWNDFGQESSSTLRVTTANAFTGKKAVRLTYVTDNNTNSLTPTPSIFQSLVNPPTHIYARSAIYHSADFSCSKSTGVSKRFKLKDSTGNPHIWVHCYFGQWAIGLEGPYDTGASAFYSSGVAVKKGGWDQVMLEVQLNTPGERNGFIKLHVNGQVRASTLNRGLIGPTTTSKCGPDQSASNPRLCPSTWRPRTVQIYLQSGDGELDYDRFGMADTPFSMMSATASTVDTTPPSSPQDVRAQ